MNDVAGVDLAQADDSADRRGDARIDELQFRVVDLPLVGFDRALVLAHQRLLGVDVLREERAIALEVELGVLEQRLILRQLSLCLSELHFERSRVDLGEQFARLDELALAKRHLHELAVDARANSHHVAWRDGPERAQVDIDAALPSGCGNDGQRARVRIEPTATRSRGRIGTLVEEDEPGARCEDCDGQQRGSNPQRSRSHRGFDARFRRRAGSLRRRVVHGRRKGGERRLLGLILWPTFAASCKELLPLVAGSAAALGHYLT